MSSKFAITMNEATIPDQTVQLDCSCVVFFSILAKNWTNSVSSMKAVLKLSSYLEFERKISVKISSVSLCKAEFHKYSLQNYKSLTQVYVKTTAYSSSPSLIKVLINLIASILVNPKLYYSGLKSVS